MDQKTGAPYPYQIITFERDLFQGQVTSVKPSAEAGWRVWLSWYARSITKIGEWCWGPRP